MPDNVVRTGLIDDRVRKVMHDSRPPVPQGIDEFLGGIRIQLLSVLVRNMISRRFLQQSLLLSLVVLWLSPAVRGETETRSLLSHG